MAASAARTPLSGRRVLVTGGSSGIGLAIARAFVSAGASVGLVARSAERLERAAAEVGAASSVPADVGRREQAERAVTETADALGGLDVLVNCAGSMRPVSTEMDLADAEASWDAVLGANLKSSFLCTMAAARYLPRPGGRIINVSSIGAYTGGSAAGGLAYAAAKAGVIGLTRALTRELAPEGITANAIAPGFIADTAFFGPGDQSERIEHTMPLVPAGRAGQPTDVAAVAIFLASPAADYVQGQVLHVNGGWHLGG